MKKLIKLLVAVLAVSFISCQSNDPNHIAQETLKDELMVVHDEVMPKMGEIHQLKKKLKKLSTDTTVNTEEFSRQVSDAILALDKADDGMMDWMGAFKSPSKLRNEEKSHEDIMAYLNEEKKKVEKVKEDILSSIKNANEILERSSNQQ